MDAGDIDAVLEVWPSGHAADYATYIDEKKTVVDIGLLGPAAKIGWYVPTFVVDEHPELATWEGFKDPELAKLFATAESGDLGQFLMGDPSYVSYDEQIIANLELPLKFVVAGSEAALITAIEQAEADQHAGADAVLAAALVAVEGRPDRGQAARGHRRVPGVGRCRRRRLRLRLPGRRAVQGGQRRSAKPRTRLRSTFLQQVPADHRSAERDRRDDRQRRHDRRGRRDEWVAANPDVVAAWLA